MWKPTEKNEETERKNDGIGQKKRKLAEIMLKQAENMSKWAEIIEETGRKNQEMFSQKSNL